MVSAMAALVIAVQEADLFRATSQGQQERPADTPPAQGPQLLPPKVQHDPSPTGAPPSPERAQGPPVTGAPPAPQERQGTPCREEHSPEQAPAAKKSAPPKPPTAVGATAKGKAMPARGVPAKPLEKAAGDQAGEEAPQEGSESTYSSYYNSSQSSDAQAQENERPTAKEKPPTPSGERQQARPGPEARREPSGEREQQRRDPPKDQRRVHLAPQREAAPAGTAALSSSKSYAPRTKEPGTPMTADAPRGSPHATAAATPRAAASESAPGEKSDPVPDGADRAPTGAGPAAAIALAAAVTAMSSGAGRTDPSPPGPGVKTWRTACRRAGGIPDPIIRRRRATRGRRAFRIRGRSRAGTRPTAIKRALASVAGRIRTGLRIALTEVAQVRARAAGAGEEAWARRLSSARNHDTPSPEQRSSGTSRSAERGAWPRGSPRRSRTTTNAGEAAGVATGRAQPTKEPAGQAQGRRSCPRRPRPAELPDGSNESPATAEGSVPSPVHGARNFPERSNSLVHRFSKYYGLFAPWRREQGPRKPTTGRRGRHCRTWQEKMGVLALWKPGRGGECGRTPTGIPPGPPGGEVGSGPRDARNGNPILPTGEPGGNCQRRDWLRLTAVQNRTQWPACGKCGDGDPPSRSGRGKAPRTIEGAGAGLPKLDNPRDAHPSHDRLKGVRIGEASNPGPAITLPPWRPDSDHTTYFAVFGTGWVVFVFVGSIVSCGTLHSFQAGAPRGAGQRHLSSRGRVTSSEP